MVNFQYRDMTNAIHTVHSLTDIEYDYWNFRPLWFRPQQEDCRHSCCWRSTPAPWRWPNWERALHSSPWPWRWTILCRWHCRHRTSTCFQWSQQWSNLVYRMGQALPQRDCSRRIHFISPVCLSTELPCHQSWMGSVLGCIDNTWWRYSCHSVCNVQWSRKYEHSTCMWWDWQCSSSWIRSWLPSYVGWESLQWIRLFLHGSVMYSVTHNTSS